LRKTRPKKVKYPGGTKNLPSVKRADGHPLLVGRVRGEINSRQTGEKKNTRGNKNLFDKQKRLPDRDGPRARRGLGQGEEEGGKRR